MQRGLGDDTMATTATVLTTQLAQPQTNTTTPTLRQRQLAGFLEGLIRHPNEALFHKVLSKGADVNFSGLDDKGGDVSSHLSSAINFFNIPAFDALLEKGADIHRVAKGSTTPLFTAVTVGSVYMTRELLKRGADPLDYQGGTCLSLLLDVIGNGTLLESQNSPLLKSRWRYEDEPLSTDNAALEKQISDFFHQQGVYVVPSNADHAIPFVESDKAIHVHFPGKLEILGLLLNKYHVSPLIPVAGTKRTPLKIVRNPTKYAKIGLFGGVPGIFDTAFKYVGTEEGQESTLIFTMKFWNKRYTGSLPIVLHYDLKPSKKLIESAVAHLSQDAHAFTQSLSTRLDTHQSSVQGQLAVVQGKLSDVRTETAYVAQEMKQVKEAVHYDALQEIAGFTARINGHPNAQEAYKSFQISLEAIRIGALAVKSGAVNVSKGPAALVASVLDMSKELVDMIPIVGSAASKLFGLASSAAKEIDTVRQTNLFTNIADMLTAEEAQKIFESVARKLTMAYFEQFERLATKQLAEEQMNSTRTKQFVQNAAGTVLNKKFVSPSQRVTAFAIIWMVDEVFNNVHKLDSEIAEKGLEAILLNVVTQRTPPEKLITFWNEITSTLGINQVPTQTASGTISGETWNSADFWTAPGIVVRNSSDFQFFSGSHSNVAKFGWRLGSLENVQTLGLVPTTGTALLPQPSSRLNCTPPSPIVPAYLNLPKPAAFNSNADTPLPLAPPLSPHEIKSASKQDNLSAATQRSKSPRPLGALGRLRAACSRNE
jgi:hypothetical protein